MEMKNPSHPGALAALCLDDLGLGVAEAAKGLGVTRQQLHNIVGGRSGITPEMAIRFEKAFGSTADTWLRMQVNYDLAQARKKMARMVVHRFRPKTGMGGRARGGLLRRVASIPASPDRGACQRP